MLTLQPAQVTWLSSYLGGIFHKEAAVAPIFGEGVPSAGAQPGIAWSKSQPFPARVKNLYVLNGPGSKKETIHVELDLAGSGLSYEPGDVLGAFARNCPTVVDDFLTAAGLRMDEAREVDGERVPLSEVLETYDITNLTRPFIKKYAALTENAALETLLESEQKEALMAWMWGRELRDLFLEYPPERPLTSDQVFSILRTQPPRLYSIASSLKAHPDEVHLTIAAVRYHSHGRDRKGVCSTYFTDLVSEEDRVSIYLHRNKNFKLPVDTSTPIIMVGPGTGIAPFRSFVEERAAIGATGKSWLFFGDWTRQNDFLYELEWEQYLQSGVLTRLDVAFSRDQDYKIYVQDRIRENAAELYAWIAEGAHLYVCGDAKRMAVDVHQAFIDLVAEHGGTSPEEAAAYVKQLQVEKRYQRDVY